MIDNRHADVAEIGVRLLDAAYLAWFSAERESWAALHAWFQARGQQRMNTFAAYRAALDREDAAARDLERLWQLVEPCPDSLVRDRQHMVE
jgi:hypothetical protein